jgi:hypothetical protein
VMRRRLGASIARRLKSLDSLPALMGIEFRRSTKLYATGLCALPAFAFALMNMRLQQLGG